MKFVVVACSVFLVTAAIAADQPSRPADKGCAWRKLSDANLGLEAWVQRCTYSANRTIDFVAKDHSLVMRDSDGREPLTVIRLFDLQPGETPEQGLRRIYTTQTDKKIASRCVLAPYKPAAKRAGVKRYDFVPDKAYQKQLDAVKEDGVPDPPCGDLGTQPDSVQYFEVQPSSGSRKVMLVDGGQDVPLFDDETLRLLPAKK
ncbi:MAG TPA: hypothetical protein VGR95_21465 [Thermoanaerobaculia bacterium]|jgi:hypothetical protein|nr:hypothetical protein [Thermoanaerobaculia bacterium]